MTDFFLIHVPMRNQNTIPLRNEIEIEIPSPDNNSPDLTSSDISKMVQENYLLDIKTELPEEIDDLPTIKVVYACYLYVGSLFAVLHKLYNGVNLLVQIININFCLLFYMAFQELNFDALEEASCSSLQGNVTNTCAQASKSSRFEVTTSLFSIEGYVRSGSLFQLQ